MAKLIFFPNWFDIFVLASEGKNATEIYKALDISYSHIINIFNEFEERGWIERVKVGRKVLPVLTEKGVDVANACDILIEALSGD